MLAPAISAQPYKPEAVNFDERLPPLERVAGAPGHAHSHADSHGGSTYRSGVITAPARFDLAGLAGELRPVELRAREAGGEWSRWVEIANGDPAWFGGADQIQARTRGWRPQGHLGFVNVSGDPTPLEGALTAVRGAVNGAIVSAAGLLAAERAGAEIPKPKMISRKRWGAERPRAQGGCVPRREPQIGVVRAAGVHHTVSANNYSRVQASDVVLGICRYHRYTNNWDDIGYQALVDRFGRIYAGRKGGLKRAVIGAHAEGVNSQTTGVAVVGTHTAQQASRKAIGGLSRYLAWKLVQHGRSAKGRAALTSAGGQTARYPKGKRFKVPRIFGHRQTNLTACPGDKLFRQVVRKVRDRVQRRIDKFGGVPATGSGADGGGATPRRATTAADGGVGPYG